MARPHLLALVLLMLGGADLLLLNLWLVPAARAPSRSVAPTALPAVQQPTVATPTETASVAATSPTPPAATGAEVGAAAAGGRAAFRGIVLFPFDGDGLDAAALAAVAQAAQQYRQFDAAEVRVEGHADASGSEAYNVPLSERRAQAVAAALVQAGVPPTRIAARGYGSSQPPTDGPHSSGSAGQRRVEIVVRSTAP